MSVIPWILQGPARTVVQTEEDFDAAGGRYGASIFVRDLQGDQLDPAGPNASYDLRVGSEYKDHRYEGKWDLGEDDRIKLLPGAAVIIRTKEWVHFPASAFGHVVPKVSLLQNGVSNTSSKVDPGYYGPLLITVFNLGKKTISLARGDPFCALYILQVGQGSRPRDDNPKEISGRARTSRWARLKDFVERNAGLIGTIALLVGIAQGVGTVVKQFF